MKDTSSERVKVQSQYHIIIPEQTDQNLTLRVGKAPQWSSKNPTTSPSRGHSAPPEDLSVTTHVTWGKSLHFSTHLYNEGFRPWTSN